MRPVLHYTPRRGWMNDPNGLIQHNGVHHLYYQTNPNGTNHADMHWGHATSLDLINWIEQPIALAPGAPDSPYDADGVFSGITVEVDGRIAALYTGVDGEMQLPCVAWATDDDLMTFVKDPANPVIADHPDTGSAVLAFRDHSITRSGDTWRQLVGGGTENLGGAVFVYTATDFHDWTYRGVLTDGTRTAIPGEIWECPDLFTLDGHTVLIIAAIIGDEHVTWHAVGTDDGDTFKADSTSLLDAGHILYAPQSYWAEDGRRLLIGWLRTHLDPGAADADWIGVMSLPRELTVLDGRLHQTPAREIRAARGLEQRRVVDSQARTDLTGGPLGAFELELPEPLARVTRSITFHDATAREFTVRPPDLGGSAAAGPLTIFFDHGIVEAFRDGYAGAWSHTALATVTSISLDTTEPAPAEPLRLWPLSPNRGA